MPIATEHDVIAAYRVILGREPDTEGLRLHTQARLSHEALVRSLVASPEYRTRQQDLGTVVLYGRQFAVSGAHTIYHEDYEAYVFHRLMGLLGPGKVFVDVGANVGMFAVHAALRGAQVIAVEARPSNCVLLLENARRHGVSVELHPLAVSDRHGYAGLEVAADSENALLRSGPAAAGDQIVATGVLDELIGDRPVDVLKIDIEGHEYRALLGARRLLARCRPVIVSEYHPDYEQAGSGVAGAVYLDYLIGFGYHVSILERSGEIRTVEQTAEIDELCRNQGYHADLLLEPDR